MEIFFTNINLGCNGKNDTSTILVAQNNAHPLQTKFLLSAYVREKRRESFYNKEKSKFFEQPQQDKIIIPVKFLATPAKFIIT